jgi:hypothetical protein
MIPGGTGRRIPSMISEFEELVNTMFSTCEIAAECTPVAFRIPSPRYWTLAHKFPLAIPPHKGSACFRQTRSILHFIGCQDTEISEERHKFQHGFLIDLAGRLRVVRFNPNIYFRRAEVAQERVDSVSRVGALAVFRLTHEPTESDVAGLIA